MSNLEALRCNVCLFRKNSNKHKSFVLQWEDRRLGKNLRSPMMNYFDKA